MPFYGYQIAAGNNNAAGLVNFETITPSGEPHFLAPQNFGHFDPGSFRIRGDGTVYIAGFGSTSWIIEAITKGQFRYLQTTYCGNSYSGLVTIRTRTDIVSTYSNFNAVMRLPKLEEMRKVTSGFADCRIRFDRLVAI